ncbi:NAD(P)/FAD-dependent oxidoreductase [Pseudemcibacter aquimaris]|uniref:NAD(P)/FAD-dependent oxidoreductase n=1 Tax=Pseudemcibacter aquimaris TaxID=2857064 RepID=UPI0020132A2C|nr:NAD(P)/FAD-dependent oxidoreductase [Pseudemcibacter aquimaris]MCC3862101.1 NAD(P)-binding protein [Pseudemcibacter aquimaris]WDU58854.1 NAD(P)-binding protein [Pseudemcibacter aquimaris]
MKNKTFANINRRDFLGGVALTGAAGMMLSPAELLAKQSGTAANYYPPALTGMRGSHVGSFEVAHSVSWEGKDWGIPKDQTDDTYDMIVVGGGISGLSAAFLYQQKSGGGKKILILDNHDDFGGHAKRNEFTVDDVLIIGYGGSQTIQDPGQYSPEAAQLLKDISIETDRFYGYYDQDFYKKWKLSSALYFKDDKKVIRDPFQGENGFIGGIKMNKKERIALIRDFPISEEAQDALIEHVFDAKDRLPDLSTGEKIVKLRGMSYTDFLEKHCDMPKEARDIIRDSAIGLWGAGWDALSALEAINMWQPGMRHYDDVNEVIFADEKESEPYIFHFPDGNAGVARSLVRKLIPDAVPGSTMEDLVLARVDYSKLDQGENDNRIRLSSTAVNVQHTADQSHVDVTYVNKDTPYRVRAKHVVMACYNNIIPYICPEVPEKQEEAINYATKIPLVYTNVVIRNWRAFAELETSRFHIPNSDLTQDYYLDFPVSMGGYDFSENPDRPIVVHGTYVPTVPDQGFNQKEQSQMGRMKVYQTDFSEFEKHVYESFDGMLKGGGFDAEHDIAAITVNRWPHGYSWEYNHLHDDPSYTPYNGPHIAGRARIGRISIANADASAYAYVNGAIDAAVRAVNEQISL